MFQKALLDKYKIRNCVVRLERMARVEDINKEPSEDLRLAPKEKSLRSNVSWLPLSSTTQKNSSEAMAALENYRKEIDFVPTVTGKNVIRQRAKSVYIESIQPDNSNENGVTMDDLHLEFREKYNSHNRGLKSVGERQLPEAQAKPISQYQKIYNEFLVKLAAKKTKNKPK